MYLTRLALQNFRNFADLVFHPEQGLNILIGRNAQGKTSLLEAVYLAATARSWRAGRDSEMVKWKAESAHVEACVHREARNDIDIDIILSRNEKKQISINTIRQNRLSDVIGQVNVVLIEPHHEEIVRGEPGRRRRFLDLEISQIQPRYCLLLSNYRRILDQRNRLLREMEYRPSGSGVLQVLNEQLASYGAEIIERRLAFVDRISSIARVIHSQITEGLEEMDVKYVSKIDVSLPDIKESFQTRLQEIGSEEIRRGVTLVGPQRDDLVFTINGHDARTYASQGQQRTIGLSLFLAEFEVMEEESKEPPIVLLDDVMTDLDEIRRAHIFEITSGRCQAFLTAPTKKSFDETLLSAGKIFIVEEGRVMEE